MTTQAIIAAGTATATSSLAQSLAGKQILVTGATAGIGRATALALAHLGANVIVTGRSAARAADVVAAIRREAPGTTPLALTADLATVAGVCALAEQVRGQVSRLDVLVNNAGAMFFKRQLTADGFERTWAVDHLALVRLTVELLPLLRAAAPARIINVASMMHASGRLNFDDLSGATRYRGMAAYSQAKLASVLCTYALARRLDGTGITVNCLHPGMVVSDMAREMGPVVRWLYNTVMGLMALTPEAGAATTVHVASTDDGGRMTGGYFDKSRPSRSSPATYDEALQERVWTLSLEQVGLSPSVLPLPAAR